jgi:hypothetical protein
MMSAHLAILVYELHRIELFSFSLGWLCGGLVIWVWLETLEDGLRCTTGGDQ